jgi:hypothetical protein
MMGILERETSIRGDFLPVVQKSCQPLVCLRMGWQLLQDVEWESYYISPNDCRSEEMYGVSD